MSSFLDGIMNDPGKFQYGAHGDTKAQPRKKRSRKENARRKAVREKIERGLERRRFWTPEMIVAEEARLREEVAKIIDERRAQDQDQAA
jgi:hypothetical protein